MESLKNLWGTVRPYTRHLARCKHHSKKDHNSCDCPKWLYVNREGEVPRRYTLMTPSWAEAMEEAMAVLKGFDPEIAAIRDAKNQQQEKAYSVLDAINMWIDRTRNKVGTESSTVSQYRSTFGWVDKDGRPRGTLLSYLDRYNRERPATKRIHYIHQITPLWLQQFYDGNSFADLSNATKRQRWGTVRSFFAWLKKIGVIATDPSSAIDRVKDDGHWGNIPFTADQYEIILSNADWYVDDRVKDGERQVYCRRMRAFVELLRWTGMDIIDAVQFHPDQQIDSDGVLRYRRTKTKALAIIPLLPRHVDLFRNIPTAPDVLPDMPFRYRGNALKSDAHNWGRRCAKLFELAGIKTVSLQLADGRLLEKSPNAKAFRHTFAVWALSTARMRLEVVSKMLGHKLVTTTEKHYLPWVQERDHGLIQEVREALAEPNVHPPRPKLVAKKKVAAQ
jgi:integrase